MKKRVLSLVLAIVLIICTFATLSACGRKLKDREITPTIEDIWQDHTGMVYAEVGNLGDYLKDKDAGKEMHFSINGGEWCRGFSWRESEENPGNCIYAFLSTKSEEEKITEYLTEGEVLHIQPGTTINVSARTPENYYYKPSAESEQKTYTLKSKLQNALSWSLPISRFSRDVDSSGFRFSDDAETQDEKKVRVLLPRKQSAHCGNRRSRKYLGRERENVPPLYKGIDRRGKSNGCRFRAGIQGDTVQRKISENP